MISRARIATQQSVCESNFCPQLDFQSLHGQISPSFSIEQFLEAVRHQAICCQQSEWSLYEACCLQLLQAAEDERLPPFVRELCRDYAWRPLDELQRLVSATCSQHHCRDRLLCLSRHLERLLVQSHERTPGMYLYTCLEPVLSH